MELQLHPAATRGYRDLGWIRIHQGFHLRQPPAPGRDRCGALINLDHGLILPGSGGFGMHAHHNTEIVTVLLHGNQQHNDDYGHNGYLTDQQVQLISAGTGIHHDEHNASVTDSLEVLQIWVVPRAKDLPPGYQKIDSTDAQRNGRLQLIVSPTGEDNSLKINQDAWFWRGTLPQGAGLRLEPHLPTNGLYVLVIEGQATVQGVPLAQRDALAASGPGTSLDVLTDTSTDLLVIEVPVD